MKFIRLVALWLIPAIAVSALVTSVVLMDRLMKLRRDLDRVRIHADRATTQLEAQAIRVRLLETRISGLRNDIAAQDTSSLHASVATLRASYEDLESQVTSLDGTYFGLRQQIDDIDYKISKPFSCSSGDFVVWGSFYEGFTC